MFEFLGKLADAGQYVPLTIIIVLFFFIVVAAAMILFKFAANFKPKKGKLQVAGQTLEFDGTDDSPKDTITSPQQKTKTDMPTFISTIQQIVDCSVENGSAASLKRQQLYDSQMRYINDKFENIRTIIEFDYTQDHPQSVLVFAVLKYAFNTAVIEKLEHICRADKLIERTKEKLVEEQRSLINNGYMQVINELKKYISNSTKDFTNDLHISYLDEDVLNYVKKRQDDIGRAITECLEHSWDEANTYFEEVREVRRQLSNEITRILKSYIDSDEHNQIPDNWYKEDKLPPNNVVGGEV